MNVLSLLITGHPYNFATYWKAVANYDSIKNTPSDNAANNFYTAIRGQLEKRNALWGNFIPFKNLIMDEEAFAKAQQGLFSILNINNDIENNLNQIRELDADAIKYNMHFNVNVLDAADRNKNLATAQKITERRGKIQEKLDASLTNLNTEYKSYFNQIGDDITFDFDNFMGENSDQSKLADPNSRRALRRKVNFLTRRMSYSVRANEDKNLFVVDDFYDKDFDIAAFNSALSDSFRIYNNEFWDVRQKIKAVAQLLNLEVFCDSQGHIRVRPPQYNRMPSSIFHKMMYQKKVLNVQVFPQFLMTLFEEQLSSLGKRLEIIEDEIRLDCALLNIKNDRDIEQFIVNPKLSDQENNNAQTRGVFTFISAPDGVIVDYTALKEQANPVSEDIEKTDFKKIEDQYKNNSRLFTSYQRFTFIKQLINEFDEFEDNNPYNMVEENDLNGTNLRINELISRIEIKSGQKVSKSSFYATSPEPYSRFEKSQPKYIDAFKVVKDLSAKLSSRQKIIKLFYETLKNSSEFSSLDDDNSVANKLLSSGQFTSQKVPEVFEHMIEDETNDDYGPNSGQRYIIKNSQIKSYTIQENPPELTYVEVRGVLNPYNPQLADDLRAFPQGGNGLVTGAAIDYDLWRNYGWREGSPVEVPFLNDPRSQCAPYAVSILSRARKNILGGTLTIVGNEYMQPGEVIFLENRGLLFYVTSVQHNFTFGGSFTTTLNLSYGHSPGEYIPTTMDVIGKMLYNNKETANIEVQRNATSVPGSSFGAIIYSPNKKISDPLDLFKGPYGKNNQNIINNLAYTAQYSLYKNSSAGNNLESNIELRIYSLTDEPDSDLKNIADGVKEILIGNAFPPEDKDISGKNSNANFPTFNEKNVTVEPIKLIEEQEVRSPSDKAWVAVRGLIEQSGVAPSSTSNSSEDVSDADKLSLAVQKKERKKLTTVLTKYIIDCWIVTKTIDPSEAK
jgi:hypothetical protein